MLPDVPNRSLVPWIQPCEIVCNTRTADADEPRRSALMGVSEKADSNELQRDDKSKSTEWHGRRKSFSMKSDLIYYAKTSDVIRGCCSVEKCTPTILPALSSI